MDNILNNKFGKSLPPATIYAGYAFIIIGLITAYSNPYVGIFIIIIGAFIGFTRYGVQLDFKKKQFKEYNNFFGWKQGKWKPYSPFPFLTIIRSKITTAALSRSNRQASTGSNIYYDICFLNQTHRQKIAIKRLKGKEQAIDDAKELANILGMQLTKYNPYLSSQTQSRKKQRK